MTNKELRVVTAISRETPIGLMIDTVTEEAERLAGDTILWNTATYKLIEPPVNFAAPYGHRDAITWWQLTVDTTGGDTR